MRGIVFVAIVAVVSLALVQTLLSVDSVDLFARKHHNQAQYPELDNKNFRIRNYATNMCITTYKFQMKEKHDVVQDVCETAKRPIQTFYLINIVGKYVITSTFNEEKRTASRTYSLYFGPDTVVNGHNYVRTWVTAYDSNRFFNVVKNSDNTYTFLSENRALQPQTRNKEGKLILRQPDGSDLQKWELIP